MDTHAALEYQTFKVPYEVLNKQFREAQKSLERQNARLKESVSALSPLLTGNASTSMDEVSSGRFSQFRERVAQMDGLLNSVLRVQEASVRSMEERADYLQKGTNGSLNSMEQWMWDKERVDRLVVQHLLRCGYLKSARQLAEKTGLASKCDLEMFEKANAVEEGLRNQNTGPCLEWIHEHRSKLRRLSSSLEVAVRVQEAVEMVLCGRRAEALRYVRRFLSQAIQENDEEALRLMGFIGCGGVKKISAYRHMASPERWAKLVEHFRKDMSALFQMPEQSTFSSCLQTGICAFKTPACAPGANDRCVACQPSVFALSEGLPHAHVSNSRLVCAYTGEPLDEKNVPLMLNSGRVYGERAIRLLREGDVVRCPRTDTTTPIKHVMRLFVL